MGPVGRSDPSASALRGPRILHGRLGCLPAPRGQHGHARGTGHRIGLGLLDGSGHRTGALPGGNRTSILRGRGRRDHAGRARTGTGVPGAWPHVAGSAPTDRPQARTRARDPRRSRAGGPGRGGGAARAGGGASGGAPARGWRGRGGGERGRRIDDHRREHPGLQVTRRLRDRRHRQPVGLDPLQGDPRGEGHGTRPHRPDGPSGAGVQAAGPAPGRPGRGRVRPRGHDRGHPRLRSLVHRRAGAAPELRRGGGGGGAGDRLSVCARARHPDLDHGCGRQGSRAGCAGA